MGARILSDLSSNVDIPRLKAAAARPDVALDAQRSAAAPVERAGLSNRPQVGPVVKTAARVGGAFFRALESPLAMIESLFEGLFGGGSSAGEHQQASAPTPAATRSPRIDPTRFSDEEMDQRRAALAQRFGREVSVENEQMEERDQRIRRESGQSYR